MKLPSPTMGFARVSFPLIQAGGMWQCRYSCILWAAKLRPPIWIQAFQIVKWHSSFSVSPDFSWVLEVLYSPHISFFFLPNSQILHPFLFSLLLFFSCLLSCSPSDFRPCSLPPRASVTTPSSPAMPSCPHPHPLLPLGNPKKGATPSVGVKLNTLHHFGLKRFLGSCSSTSHFSFLKPNIWSRLETGQRKGLWHLRASESRESHIQ